MAGVDKERVHQILWDWVLSEARNVQKETLYRQSMVRTLYRLATSRYHISDMLTLAMSEDDVSIMSTLSWACYQSLSKFPADACQEILQHLSDQIAGVLRHPSLSQKLLCCEMVYTLTRRRRISTEVLARLDAPMVAVLHEHPRRPEVVQVIVRYFLLRTDPVAVPDMADLLPCSGLAWASVIEYLATVSVPRKLDATSFAPLPSEYQIKELVGLWSPTVQRAFIHLVTRADLEALRGEPLLNIVEVLDNCGKASEKDWVHVVPYLVSMLEDLDHTTSSGYRFRVWDAGWRVLDKMPPSAVLDVFDRLVALVGRLPELSFSWSKDRIKRVFTTVYHVLPGMFDGLDIMELCMVEVLPDALLHHHMDAIVDLMSAETCGVHHHAPHCRDMGCLKLVCRMTAAELRVHRDFVALHMRTLIYCISLEQPDIHVQVAWRQLLPLVPDQLYDACVPLLKDIVQSGNGPGLLALSHLPAARLRLLRHCILYRVLTLHDILTDHLIPTPAMILMSRLPDDVLVAVVDGLVHPQSSHIEGMSLHLLSNPCHNVEKRLFVLKHLPVHLILHHHVTAIAGAYLKDSRPRIRQLVMEIILRTKSREVCGEYREWCMDILVTSSRKSLQFQASKMLRLLDIPVLADVLHRRGVRQVCPRHACALLDCLDDTSLSTFSEDVLYLCERYHYLDRAVQLLGRLSWETLWALKDRVLSLLEARDQEGFRWDGSRHILNIFANAGILAASEMLLENNYRDLLAV